MTLKDKLYLAIILTILLAVGVLYGRYIWLPDHVKTVAAQQTLKTLQTQETTLQTQQKAIETTAQTQVVAVQKQRAQAQTPVQQEAFVKQEAGLDMTPSESPDVLNLPEAELPKLADLVADDQKKTVELAGGQAETKNVEDQLANCNDQKKTIKQVLKDKHTWMKLGIGVGVGVGLSYKFKH
jgi:hypothetical protein